MRGQQQLVWIGVPHRNSRAFALWMCWRSWLTDMAQSDGRRNCAGGGKRDIPQDRQKQQKKERDRLQSKGAQRGPTAARTVAPGSFQHAIGEHELCHSVLRCESRVLVGLKWRRSKRGSPGSFAAQGRLAQDDNQTVPLPDSAAMDTADSAAECGCRKKKGRA